jgi:hypothetical protein
MIRRTFLSSAGAAALAAPHSLFRADNLLAWCIVPFDAKQRGPADRAAMLAGLGFRKFVYDWREKDVPLFDAEIDALEAHKIHLQGFWTPVSANPAVPGRLPAILSLIEKRRLKTELWLSLSFDKNFAALAPEAKLDAAAQAVDRVARQAAALGCRTGLDNHGGWYGEPENQVAILDRLRRQDTGIVYNFHHGHEHVARFPALLAAMKPYLMAVNINGMRQGTKILPVGDGDLELGMLRALVASGYSGPIGLLGHRAEIDAAEALRLNLDGLRKLLPRLG